MPKRRLKLTQRRKTLGFSQESLAHAVGVERSTVVRWESGETEPRPWHRPTIAAVLQLTLAELDDVLTSSAMDEERLAFTLQNPAMVDLVTVAQLAQEIERLTAEYDTASSASLLATAGQCHSQVTLLRNFAPTARIRRELCFSVAESATLMGQLVWDASQRRDDVGPVRYFDQAIAAAREIADPVLESHAQLRKGFVALYGTKDPRAGLRLCRETALVSGSVSNVLTGLGYLHVGEAHAMLGQRRECEKALSAAEVSFGRIRPDDEAITMFSSSQFDRLAGSCYLSLGANGKAEEILTRTARSLVEWKKSQAIVLGNLTLAYIRQGKLEEACGTLHEAIDLIEETRGGGGMNVAFAAGRELAPWRHEPWVQEISDRLFALMTT
ncbi:helix-turn-helix transcriptional regulator [Nonomuraea sediminis]|uniref:helix-turn-helix transcriptional regulator n=1 Tax=Nonomuraea sediminis TaxID=2835864 RepID=UPI001BDD563C|nr:helix-turn-helix domain-containing protein [Nonomuraea sediminis]